MQDLGKKQLEAMQDEQTQEVENKKEAFRECQEKGFFQPNKEKNHRGVHYPDFWRKKRMNLSFVKKLEETASKPAVVTDEYGEYKDGMFLHGCALVRVTIGKGDLWRLEIHSDSPIGLPMISNIRYKYIPNNVLMAMLFPTREEREPNNNITLYQIPSDGGESEGEE